MMDQSPPPTRDRARSIAVDLYVLRGYDGFSFADLAEATSTTRANIHHHFGNKRRLMAELIEGFVADAQQRITEIWTTPDIGFAGRFAGQLEDLRRFYLRYNPAARRPQCLEPAGASAPGPSGARRARDQRARTGRSRL